MNRRRAWSVAQALRSSRTARNFSSGILLLSLQSISYVVLAPLVLHKLGGEALGIWSLGSTLLALATLFDFGITEAVSQRVGAMQTTYANDPRLQTLCRWAAKRYLALALVGLTATPLAAAALTHIVRTQHVAHAVSFEFWVLTSAGFFIGLPSYAYTAIQTGRERGETQKNALSVEVMLQASVAIAALMTGHGLVMLGIASVIGRIGGAAFRTLAYTKATGSPLAAFRLQNGRTSLELPSLRTVALPFFLMGVATRLTLYTDNIVVGAFLNADAVGRYAFAFRVFFLVPSIAWQVSDYLFPRYAALAQVDSRALTSLVGTLLAWSSVCVLLVAGTIAVLYNHVIPHVDPRLGVSPGLLFVFVIFVVMINHSHLLGVALGGAGRQRQISRWFLADAAANLVLSIGMVEVLGSVGVILATVISTTLVLSLPLTIAWARSFGGVTSIPQKALTKGSIAPCLCLGAVVVGLQLSSQGTSWRLADAGMGMVFFVWSAIVILRLTPEVIALLQASRRVWDAASQEAVAGLPPK